MATVHPVPEVVIKTTTTTAVAVEGEDGDKQPPPPEGYRWMPSFRFLTAGLLCMCFASVHMMNSNMSMAMVCMVNDDGPAVPRHHRAAEFDFDFDFGNDSSVDNSSSPAPRSLFDLLESGEAAPRLDWSPNDQGYIFGAFNAGLILMLVTGFLADKFNAKYMVIASVIIASAANFLIPIFSPKSVLFAIFARFLVGFADALLQPALNSLLTRWFPANERSYALGVASGGRQIGGLLIMPAAGALCSQTALFGGWPAIFYFSAFVGLFFVGIYAVLSADKPSKQSCITPAELDFITRANASENVGKKRTERKVPWKRVMRSAPVWAALVSVVCHEFPLMTMIMFLPSYLHDVHHYDATENGILSSLPTLCHFFSKIGSAYLNTWLLEHTSLSNSAISKALNAIGSLGLGVFMIGATFLDSTHASLAVVFLCLSMVFTGMHTPGCQAALVAIAPAFSGAITGLTFFFVAISGVLNPLMTKWIVVSGSQFEWNIVFYISTAIAWLPIVIFTVWGSADVQWWAKHPDSYTEKQAAKAHKWNTRKASTKTTTRNSIVSNTSFPDSTIEESTKDIPRDTDSGYSESDRSSVHALP